MNIELSKKEDIPSILEILKQRCIWMKENNINQWDNSYVETFNKDYFEEVMKTQKLYVAKQESEIVGVYLLKTENPKFWNDNKKTIYIHHFATKVGLKTIGIKMLKFAEKYCMKNKIDFLRLDCVQGNERLNKYYIDYGFKYKGSKETPYQCNLYELKILNRAEF